MMAKNTKKRKRMSDFWCVACAPAVLSVKLMTGGAGRAGHGGKWLRGSVDVGNCYNCSAPWSCLRGNKGSSSTGRESLPRGRSSAPVTCALFPLGLIGRLTPREPTLDGKNAKLCRFACMEKAEEPGCTVSHVIAK